MCVAALYLKDASSFFDYTANVKCKNLSKIEKFVEKPTIAPEFGLFRKVSKSI